MRQTLKALKIGTASVEPMFPGEHMIKILWEGDLNVKITILPPFEQWISTCESQPLLGSNKHFIHVA